MNAFVVVSFDLEEPTPDDYKLIGEQLGKHGLHPYIIDDNNKKAELPSTVFAGKYGAKPSLDQLSNWLHNSARRADANIGKYFVLSTDGDWGCRAETLK